jgi:hypothetical protein
MYVWAANTAKPVYSRALSAALSIVILFSFGRVLGVMLLFAHDSRIPATAYVASLPSDTSLEATFYSPGIPLDYFEREHNYPLFIPKSAGQTAPTHKSYEFNMAEAGLLERDTDYLVVDPYKCALVQNECDFFKQLETGQSEHYQLIAEFSYALPPYLPQVHISFVNPSIRIYNRIP